MYQGNVALNISSEWAWCDMETAVNQLLLYEFMAPSSGQFITQTVVALHLYQVVSLFLIIINLIINCV